MSPGKMAERSVETSGFLRALIIGFVGQVLGRLLDLQWHLTHSEFETATDQLRAHWLIWITTLFVIGVAVVALRGDLPSPQRGGYLLVLIANVGYMLVGVIHLFQHLDHQEVEWAHFSLAVTNVAAVVGVVWVIAARRRTREATT